MRPQLASPEWLELLASRLAAVPAATEGFELKLSQIVTELPDGGEASWAIVFKPGQTPRLESPAAGEADVTLVASYGSLVALSAGQQQTSELLAAGEIKLRGDLGRLVGAAGLLEAVVAALPPTG